MSESIIGIRVVFVLVVWGCCGGIWVFYVYVFVLYVCVCGGGYLCVCVFMFVCVCVSGGSGKGRKKGSLLKGRKQVEQVFTLLFEAFSFFIKGGGGDLGFKL